MKIEVDKEINKKIADEIHFLVKYLAELHDEEFSLKEIFKILGQVTAALMEGYDVKKPLRNWYYEFVEETYLQTRSRREVEKEFEKE